MKESDIRNGIYLGHRTALIDYACPLVGSRETAEDVVQDAFLRFSSGSIQGSAPEQTLAYLYRIVRNLAFDILKRRKIERRHGEMAMPFWAMPSEVPTPEQNLMLCDRIRMVNDALGNVPVEVRVAMEMHRFGGFTLEEVSEHLGISVATAHRHVRTAMVQIALRLGQED